MAGSASIREDDSLLSRIDRSLFKLETTMALAGGFVILALMLIAVAQILGRKLLNLPVPGFIDWVEQAMAVFAFLGVAYCHRLGGHIRMDILVSQLKGRALWFAEFTSTLVIFLLILVLTWGSWLHFMRAYSLGDSSIDIALPLWPAKLLVPVAFGVLALRLVVHLISYGKAVISGEDEPVAIPLIEDAATQAAHEAEAVDSKHVEEDR